MNLRPHLPASLIYACKYEDWIALKILAPSDITEISSRETETGRAEAPLGEANKFFSKKKG